MPLGQYKDFNACYAAKRREGFSEDRAKRYCGALEQKIRRAERDASFKQNNQAIPYQDSNGRQYLKVWLIDGSVNQNQWGVTPQSIPANINTAIGKPVVIYQNTGHEPDAHRRVAGQYDHPYLAGADSVEHAYAYQDLYRVGTYIDVFESDTRPGEWWGIAEVTDQDTRKAILEDPDLPIYVSPMIHLLDHTEPENAHTKWSFVHSAIVAKPAYGAAKAYISGRCSGAKETCLLQLRKAAIEHNTEKHSQEGVGCGFCRYKAMKQIQLNIRSASSSFDNFSQHLKFDKSLSQDNNQSNPNDNNQSQQEQNNNNRNNPDQSGQDQQNQQQQQQQPSGQIRDYEQESRETKTRVKQQNNNTDNTSNDDNRQGSSELKQALETVQRLAARNKSLEMELATAKADVETHKSINNQFETRLATLEKQQEQERAAIRADQITNYVNSAPAYRLLSAQEREKQIETFCKGSMSIDEIRNIIEPLNASVQKQYQFPSRAASLSKSRLSLGANTGKTIEVRQGSSNNSGGPTAANDDEVPYYLSLPNAMFRRNGGLNE